jgi:hypothetical protein
MWNYVGSLTLGTSLKVPFFGKQFHYPLHGEKARFGPKAAAGPVTLKVPVYTLATASNCQ